MHIFLKSGKNINKRLDTYSSGFTIVGDHLVRDGDIVKIL